MQLREEWVGVIDFSNYEVSSIGRIREKSTQKIAPSHALSKKRKYLCAMLNGRRYLTHRIVLCSFMDVPLSCQWEVMHLDGNGSNNILANLKFGTHIDNMAMDRGHNHSFKGEANKNSKLSEIDVAEIRRIYESRNSHQWGRRDLAERFSVNEITIGRIAKRKKGGWVHV